MRSPLTGSCCPQDIICLKKEIICCARLSLSLSLYTWMTIYAYKYISMGLERYLKDYIFYYYLLFQVRNDFLCMNMDMKWFNAYKSKISLDAYLLEYNEVFKGL